MKKYKDLATFLTNHSKCNSKLLSEDLPITHTRIGDRSLNIFGGSFTIPNEMMEEFYEHYYEHTFINNKPEYLTEKQLLSTDAPILIDFDFKYEVSTTTRQHTMKDIENIVYLVYLETLKSIVEFEPEKPFDIFVFEKDHVNVVEEKGCTKDGIHIVIGLKMAHSVQQVLRLKVLEMIGGVITNLPLINDWENVLDDCITRGSTNWQLFGSRKPGHEPYKLRRKFTFTFDSFDKEFMDEITDYGTETGFLVDYETFKKVSARYMDNQSFPIKLSLDTIKSHSKLTHVSTIPFSKPSATGQISFKIEALTSVEKLDNAIADMLKTLNFSTEYIIKETHEFALTLPRKFYEPGSHYWNRKLAFALKKTDFRLFLTWVKVRSQSEDFSFSSIGKLFHDWNSYFNNGDHEFTGLTNKSVMFWSRDEVPLKYWEVRQKTTDVFVDISLRSGLDYDFAKTIYHMYKNEYICACINPKPMWFHFENHRWVKDKGNSLRLSISNSLFQLYEDKLKSYMRQNAELHERIELNKAKNPPVTIKEDEDKATKLQEILKSAGKNIKKLKQCSDKNNIFRETSEIFFDLQFLKIMDKNKNLMCFLNGVVDFKLKMFRNGYPDDYITKCTNIEYSTSMAYKPEIETFMQTLFPIPRMLRYMYDHLSSCLIGENVNQTFHIYRGRGSNGKSLLTDFMALVMGDC